jgi:hypothetical protein
MDTLVALVLGMTIGLGAFIGLAGLRGVVVVPPAARRVLRDRGTARQCTLAVVAAVAALALTGWLVAAVTAGVAAVVLPRAFGGARRHQREIARVEAVASWAEQLRDTMAAANGLEHAIAASGLVPPPSLAPQIIGLARRVGYEPLPEALRAFADDVDHPTCDFVVAGLLAGARGQARELGPLLGQLAECARAEAQLRARVWAGRARTRTSVRVIAACVGLFAVGLMAFDRSYLAPYDSAGGQVVLAAIVLLFGGSLVAMDRMGRLAMPARFLSRQRAEVVS